MRAAWLLLALLAAVGLAACGKKGPPLAPYPRLPRPPAEFAARRLGHQVYVRFKVPEEDADNQRPSNVEFVEVYAMTGEPRTLDDFREYGTLVASVRVRTPAPPPPPPVAPGMPPPPPPPPRPFEPGVEQGAVIVVSETLTPEMATPVLTEAELRRLEDLEIPEPLPPPVVRSPLANVHLSSPVMRHYVAVGVNRRGRYGNMTGRARVPMVTPPESPAAPVVTYSERNLELAWTAPASARLAVQQGSDPAAEGEDEEGDDEQDDAPASPIPTALPTPPAGSTPPPAPAATGAAPAGTPGLPPAPSAAAPSAAAGPAGQAATGGAGQPTAATGGAVPAPGTLAPAPLPELISRPWFPVVRPSRYNVYDVTPGETPAPPAPPPPAPASAPGASRVPPIGDEAVVEAPFPLNMFPIDQVTYRMARVEFGEARCYAVRMVDVFGGAEIESEASPPACVKLSDTFAPAAPTSLAAVAGEGAISLIWEANTEADLLGYVILRGEAGSATLQPLTTAPTKETTYRDETARPGVRYEYAVQALDTNKPPNVSAESNRVQETAR